MIALSGGCAAPPINPSFAVTHQQADAAIDQMAHDRRPLSRPVLIIGGFLDPNFGPWHMKRELERVSSDATIITVSLATCGSFDECRQRIIAAVDEACPTKDAQQTTEVDVIGLSLGGLAARYAASDGSSRQLRIARLFTVSSPHAGATLAEHLAVCQFHRDMRPGSTFIQALPHADFPIYSYCLLHDDVVGSQYTGTTDCPPWWLPNPPLISAHFVAMRDRRIFADLALRLRGQEPFSTSPPAPLPQSEQQ
jgi:hypothetical protein